MRENPKPSRTTPSLLQRLALLTALVFTLAAGVAPADAQQNLLANVFVPARSGGLVAPHWLVFTPPPAD
jgi:hypothetical protein